MAYARNWKCLLITYPHCDIPNERLSEIIRGIHRFDGKIRYMSVATEKHQDGEEHKHVFIMLFEMQKFKRDDIECQLDLIKRWFVREDGTTYDTMWDRLLDGMFVADCIDDLPKAGKDIESNIASNLWYRRFHCNIEGVRSPKHAISYCQKENNYIEYGELPFEKKLTKAEKNKLLMETPLEELVDKGVVSIFAICQLKKAVELLKNERIQSKFESKEVHWYWGPTGTGKTKTAWDEALRKYSKDDIWISNSNDQWFDGYNGQRCAIIDDLRSSSWRFDFLLRLLDRYPMQVAVKGGFRKWQPVEVFITAPGQPRELYRNHETGEPYDHIEQLERRISELREFERGTTEEVQELLSWK